MVRFWLKAFFLTLTSLHPFNQPALVGTQICKTIFPSFGFIEGNREAQVCQNEGHKPSRRRFFATLFCRGHCRQSPRLTSAWRMNENSLDDVIRTGVAGVWPSGNVCRQTSALSLVIYRGALLHAKLPDYSQLTANWLADSRQRQTARESHSTWALISHYLCRSVPLPSNDYVLGLARCRPWFYFVVHYRSHRCTVGVQEKLWDP